MVLNIMKIEYFFIVLELTKIEYLFSFLLFVSYKKAPDGRGLIKYTVVKVLHKKMIRVGNFI